MQFTYQTNDVFKFAMWYCMMNQNNIDHHNNNVISTTQSQILYHIFTVHELIAIKNDCLYV